MNPLLLALMVLVTSGVFVKWVVDDFRRSRVSATTWLLVALSLLGPIWTAMYVTSPAVQARLFEFRRHRDLIPLTLTPTAHLRSERNLDSPEFRASMKHPRQTLL